jgi:hypothetical protein
VAAWRCRQQHGGHQGGASAAAVAVAVAATAWWRRTAWRRRRHLAGSVTSDAVAALREAWRQCGGSNGSAAAVAAALRWWAAWQRRWQLGGSSLMAVRTRRWQRGRRQWRQRQLGCSGQLGSGSGDERGSGGTGSTPAAAGLAAVAEVWWHCSVSGGSRAAGAALPPRAATVATKTPAATAMAGALPTINNQQNAAARGHYQQSTIN